MSEKIPFSMGGKMFPDGRSYCEAKREQMKREFPENYRIMLKDIEQPLYQTLVKEVRPGRVSNSRLMKLLETLSKGITAIRRAFLPYPYSLD